MSVKREVWWIKGFRWGLGGLGVYVIVVLVSSLWDSQQAYKRIEVAEVKLRQGEERQQDLLRQVKEATDEAYIEKVAREELNMQKQGETLVILPEEGQLGSEEELAADEEEKANWEKWWELVK